MRIIEKARKYFKKEKEKFPERQRNESGKVKRSDWDTSPMPAKHRRFILKDRYSNEDIYYLSFGHLPGEMEDRWVGCMEGDTLLIFRSWSGCCIFTVKFEKNRQIVTVNRDKKQYTGNDVNEEKMLVRGLISGWISENKNLCERKRIY